MKKLSIKKAYLLIAAAAVTSLGGCKKIDDLVIFRDPMQMDPQIWQQEAAVQYFLNDTYQFIMPVFPYEYTANGFAMHLASDENYYSATETVSKKYLRLTVDPLLANDCKYLGFKYAGNNYGENRYFDVAKCNIAIKNLPGSTGIPEANKKKLLGQFYALRGMMYFGLTKVYGGMPLVLEPQNPQSLNVGGREKAHTMFDQIIRDYDSAIVNLEGVTYDAAQERGKIDKIQVLCLKAQALKWWASPLFNPKGDASRWTKAFTAIEAAYKACDGPYKLMSNYGKIFITEGSLQTEAIIVRSYSPNQPKKFQQAERNSRPTTEGGSPQDWYNPSKQMIDAYTMRDGYPATTTGSSATYPYDDVLFWANRDPRFDATIVWNGAKWGLSGNDKRKQWTYAKATYGGLVESTKPFYVRKFSDTTLPKTNVVAANDLGGNGLDWIEYRFAELTLDYAEAANETGKLSLAKDMVRKIRIRAGIVQGDKDYGLDFAVNQDQMRDLILNERMVEFAFEGKRNDDLRRTRRLHLLQGTIAQLKQIDPVVAKLTDDLEKPIGTNALGLDPSLLRRDTINMYNKDAVLKHFKLGYTWQIPSGNLNFVIPETYYWFGLSNQFMNSSPLLEQTIGWDGGTFDPLSE